MSKKIRGSVSTATRRKLEGLAAAKFNGGIGKATMHVVRLALASPDHKNTMTDGHNAACSVDVDEALVAQITDFQVKKGIAKRTDATKRLIEIGLSIVDAGG